jgi:glycosyltransferase involved in cell wall biosynthesis
MTSTSAFIAKCSAADGAARRLPPLFVFSDDWGRHPSSCQHLVRQFLDRHEVYWINTIGTRKPRLDLATIRRGFSKARQWLAGSGKRDALPANLRVRNPWMWPSFGSRFGRWLNLRLLGRHLTKLAQSLPEPPVVLTTIPLVADLVGRLPARRWVYYCVDDFSKWPGLDQTTMQHMEERLVERVDALVAASENLCQRLAQMGRDAQLLTHGVDLNFWADGEAAPLPEVDNLERPLVVFWGVIDRRMDVAFVKALAESLSKGTVLLVGPEANPDPALYGPGRIVHLAPLPFERLPLLARAAEVVVMPYADLPVTRAMQPLKLKEYLATGKPAVVRDLPANRAWADCLDLAATPAAFVEAVRQRLATGLPEAHKKARSRLAGEGWDAKARLLEKVLEWEATSASS